jgi:hypothetical protein
MFRSTRKSYVSLIVGAAFLFSIVALPAVAQELEKKYAPILGDYEFDLTEAGMGIVTIQFYIENNALWAWPQDVGEPAELIPVEGEEFVFVIEGGDGQSWKVEFQKDDSGKYTKCHTINEAMGLDVVGEKIIE